MFVTPGSKIQKRPRRLKGGDLGTAAIHAAGDFCATANNLSDVVAALARANLSVPSIASLLGYISGLTLSTTAGSSTFGVASGLAMSNDDTTLMTLASAYTKTTGAWAVGSGNGALDTGTISNGQWYHFYLIERPDTGVTDPAISLSPTAVTTGGNIPAAYTKQRRLGARLLDGSGHWLPVVQRGIVNLWTTLVHDVASASDGDTLGHTFALSVPTGVQVDAIINGFLLYGSATAYGLLTSPDQTDTAAGASNYTGLVGSASQFAFFDRFLRTDTNAQLRRRASHASASWDLCTPGWVDYV